MISFHDELALDHLSYTMSNTRWKELYPLKLQDKCWNKVAIKSGLAASFSLGHFGAYKALSEKEAPTEELKKEFKLYEH